MSHDKSLPFQMRVTPAWLEEIDDWRRTQKDLPSRAEAIRRLVEMGLRFGINVGAKINTPKGPATVTELSSAMGRVYVATGNGDGYNFSLSEIEALPK